jgi:hypothetical protein
VSLQSAYGHHQFQARSHGPLCIVLVSLRIAKVDEDAIETSRRAAPRGRIR